MAGEFQSQGDLLRFAMQVAEGERQRLQRLRGQTPDPVMVRPQRNSLALADQVSRLLEQEPYLAPDVAQELHRPEARSIAATPVQESIAGLPVGWCVIPLAPRSKVPYKGFSVSEFYQKNPSREQVVSWKTDYWAVGANYAVITGRESGVFVLEIDSEDGLQLLLEHGSLPQTVTEKTHRGYHFYFKYPQDGVPSRIAFLPGCDVSSDRHYVVCSPSIHPAGTPYEWVFSPDEIAVAEAPDWLLSLIRAGAAEAEGQVAPVGCVALDVDLGRLSAATKTDKYFRVWAAGKASSVPNGGWISKDELYACLTSLDVGSHQGSYSTRYFNQLLEKGDGLYWNLAVKSRRVYLFSSERLTAKLLRLAVDLGQVFAASRHLPGAGNEWFVPIGGKLKTWRAMLYACWYQAKGGATIARDTLCALWGLSSRETLYDYERDEAPQHIDVRHNEVQAIVPADGTQSFDQVVDYFAVPYAQTAYTRKGELLLTKQIPNTYTAHGFSRAGQPCKVQRRRCAAVRTVFQLIDEQPDLPWLGGKSALPLDHAPGSPNQVDQVGPPVCRLYFESLDQLQRHIRRADEREAGAKHGLVYLGDSVHRLGIFELSFGQARLLTHPNSRAFAGAARRRDRLATQSQRRTRWWLDSIIGEAAMA